MKLVEKLKVSKKYKKISKKAVGKIAGCCYT